MRQDIQAPKISYDMEVEYDDGSTEQERRLNFQEMETYLRKCLFHLRHRTLHAEGESEIELKITLTAFNPTRK